MDDKPLPLKDACARLGCGYKTLAQMIRDGRIRTVTIGRRRKVMASAIEALLSNPDPVPVCEAPAMEKSPEERKRGRYLRGRDYKEAS